MKSIVKFALVGALLVTGIAQSNAATAAAAKTNFVSNVAFTLTSYQNGVAKAFTIANKDILGSLSFTNYSTNAQQVVVTNAGTVTTNTEDVIVTNYVTFSKKAKLLFEEILSTNNVVTNHLGTNKLFIVRDVVGKATVDTDVTPFFGYSTDFEDAIKVSSTNKTTVTVHEIAGIEFKGQTLAFESVGLSTKTIAPAAKDSANVAKSLAVANSGAGQFTTIATGGALTTNSFVFQGKVAISGGKLQ
jgi:hypothetical protein